jgi:glycosyltransferase involved in cell wall biosynthesis
VICSNNSALKEICGNAAFLINPDDTNEIAEAILTILNDDTLRQEYCFKGKQRIAKFGWQSAVNSYLKLIDQQF